MIRKFFYTLTAVLVAVTASAQFRSSGYDDLYDSETVTDLKKHVSYLASAGLEGRKAGSEGERLAAEYVSGVLESYDIDVLTGKDGEVFGICRNGKDTLVSRNVVAAISGYDKKLKEHYIVIGARLDNLGTHSMTVDGQNVENIYFGANGNASGLAMLVELAKKLSMNQLLLKKSVILVAFGASSETCAGSWYFLNRSFSAVDNIDLMVNLDMLGGGGDSFYAYTSSNKDLNDILSAVSSEMQPIIPEVTAAEPYPSDHIAFYDKEIPSVMFTTGRYPEHNTVKDTPSMIDYEQMERELEYICNFTLSMCGTEREISFRPEELKEDVRKPDVYSFYDCDIKPAFLNNTDPSVFMSKWVYQYLKYPQSAIEEGVQGTVQVNFIIEKDGSVSSAKVVKSVDQRLDDAAVKVVMASPKWRPARIKGMKVRCSMTIPVEFRLVKRTDKRKIGINGKY